MFVETPKGGRFPVQTDTGADGSPRAFCSLGGAQLYAGSVEKLEETALQLFGAKVKDGDAYACDSEDSPFEDDYDHFESDV